MSGRTARVLFRSALTRKLQTAVRFQSFTPCEWLKGFTCRSWNREAGGSLDQLRLLFPGNIHLPYNRFLCPLTSTRVSQVIYPAAEGKCYSPASRLPTKTEGESMPEKLGGSSKKEKQENSRAYPEMTTMVPAAGTN